MQDKAITSAPKATGDLFKKLLADLASEGIKPKLQWAPSERYCKMLVRGTNVAFATQQTRNGIRVEVRTTIDALPKAARKIFEAREGFGNFAVVGSIVDAASSKTAARAIALAAKEA